MKKNIFFGEEKRNVTLTKENIGSYVGAWADLCHKKKYGIQNKGGICPNSTLGNNILTCVVREVLFIYRYTFSYKATTPTPNSHLVPSTRPVQQCNMILCPDTHTFWSSPSIILLTIYLSHFNLPLLLYSHSLSFFVSLSPSLSHSHIEREREYWSLKYQPWVLSCL